VNIRACELLHRYQPQQESSWVDQDVSSWHGWSSTNVQRRIYRILEAFCGSSQFISIRNLKFDKITELGDYSLAQEQDKLLFKLQDCYTENKLTFDLEDKEKIERILSNHNMIDS